MSLDLAVRIPGRAVDACIRIDAGEHVALVGPNGAGKSTMLEALAGHLAAPRDGEIRLAIDGEDFSRTPLHKRGFAYLSQTAHLFNHMSVLDNIAYGLVSAGMKRREAREVAGELAVKVGLEGFEDRRPCTLSGGQAQKCALARALAVEPRVLLLDEPLAALDVRAAREMRGLVADLAQTRTLVCVTHDVLDLLAWADRVCVLEDGHVTEECSADDALSFPRSEFLAELAGLKWVDGEMRERGVFVTSGGVPLATMGECGLGPGRALIDPRALRLRVGDHADGTGAGRIRGISRIGPCPVAYFEDVPVELSMLSSARGTVAEGRVATIEQTGLVKVERRR